MRGRVDGFAGWDLRCVFPALGTMLGYAVTCTADSTTADRRDERGLLRLWAAVEAAPKPAVIVIKDIGPERSRSCHMGEVMATTAKALGAVGCISDGGLRDVNEVQALGGFQYFCPGFVVSHGNPIICEVNVPVTLAGTVGAARRSSAWRRERCPGRFPTAWPIAWSTRHCRYGRRKGKCWSSYENRG